MTSKIIIRKAAAKLGLKWYFTGKPCLRGHISDRLVSNGSCRKCAYAFWHRLYQARHAEMRQQNNESQRKFASTAHGQASILAYRKKNSRVASEKSSRWNFENKDRRKKILAQYKKRTRHKGAEYTARRAASKLSATPAWLSQKHIDDIKAIYLDSAHRPGGPWHVDHIVPLRGRNVCGLHVPWNLRVIPARENESKGNQLIPCLVESRV